MKLQLRMDRALPPMAWCLQWDLAKAPVVVHGERVETTEDWWYEGAWDGPFTGGNFTQAFNQMGSGGKVHEETLILATPTHLLERLHIWKTGNHVLASNSIVALLAHGLELDLAYPWYQADLIEMVQRPEKNVDGLLLAQGNPMILVHHKNVTLYPSGRITYADKSGPKPFRDYDHYHGFLADSLKQVHANANDGARTHQYAAVTTISSGYDSVACSALALQVGCKRAYTFRSARPQGGSRDDNDSGKMAALDLGLNIQEFDRDAYKAIPSAEDEFLVGADLGQDVPMAAFGPEFKGKLVMMGTHGDVVWSRGKADQTGVVKRDMSGCSLTEFRLRTGFIQVVPAFFGSSQRPSIAQISNDPSMRPWSIGGRYDRPIPRRIAEDAGVRREHFGQQKQAVAVHFNTEGSVRQNLSKESLGSFCAFYESVRDLRPPSIQLRAMRQYRIYCHIRRVLNRIPLIRRWQPFPERYRHSPGWPSFLVHWAMPNVVKRYSTLAHSPIPVPGNTPVVTGYPH